MKSIVVGFSKSKKKLPIASWLIMLFQRTLFSHTYIRLNVGNTLPSDKILHASEGLVQSMSGTQFDKKHKVVQEFEIVIPDIIVTDKLMNRKSSLYNAMLNIMHEASGDNYGTMQNIGIVYVRFMKFLGKEVDNPFKCGWNCSEFVASILMMIYPDKFKDVNLNTITPKQVRNKLLEMDECEECDVCLRRK